MMEFYSKMVDKHIIITIVAGYQYGFLPLLYWQVAVYLQLITVIACKIRAKETLQTCWWCRVVGLG